MKRESTAVDVLVSKLEAKGLDLSDFTVEINESNAVFKSQILEARLSLADELSTNPRGLSKEDKEEENEVSEHYYLLTYGNGTD